MCVACVLHVTPTQLKAVVQQVYQQLGVSVLSFTWKRMFWTVFEQLNETVHFVRKHGETDWLLVSGNGATFGIYDSLCSVFDGGHCGKDGIPLHRSCNSTKQSAKFFDRSGPTELFDHLFLHSMPNMEVQRVEVWWNLGNGIARMPESFLAFSPFPDLNPLGSLSSKIRYRGFTPRYFCNAFSKGPR